MIQIKSIRISELESFIKEKNPILLDVRSPQEFAENALPGAINIPMHLLAFRSDELPKDKEILIYCSHGTRSGHAGHFLLAKGFTKISHLANGLMA